MIRMLTETELDKEKELTVDDIENKSVDTIDSSELDNEITEKIDKFKQTFYKINGRYPNEEELKETMTTFLNDLQAEIATISGSSEGEEV